MDGLHRSMVSSCSCINDPDQFCIGNSSQHSDLQGNFQLKGTFNKVDGITETNQCSAAQHMQRLKFAPESRLSHTALSNLVNEPDTGFTSYRWVDGGLGWVQRCRRHLGCSAVLYSLCCGQRHCSEACQHGKCRLGRKGGNAAGWINGGSRGRGSEGALGGEVHLAAHRLRLAAHRLHLHLAAVQLNATTAKYMDSSNSGLTVTQ
eukprot:scaffold107241_cov14-Tisochrysis_lutea.AAC.1